MQIAFSEFISDYAPISLCKYSDPSSHILKLVLCFMNNTWVEYVSADFNSHTEMLSPFLKCGQELIMRGEKIIWRYVKVKLRIANSHFYNCNIPWCANNYIKAWEKTGWGLIS